MSDGNSRQQQLCASVLLIIFKGQNNGTLPDVGGHASSTNLHRQKRKING
jgi:hypothetical protein